MNLSKNFDNLDTLKLIVKLPNSEILAKTADKLSEMSSKIKINLI